MKKRNFAGLSGVLIVLCLLLIACPYPIDNVRSATLQDYEQVAASFPYREWIEDEYDCSNFSIQFYQNCYKANLPCRVRIGAADGIGSELNHAWNSVKIKGLWVDWEPQLKEIYNSHKKTSTPMGDGWGKFTNEDVLRMMYELIGRKVPSSVIDAYEIDAHIHKNSPYNTFFNGYCISNDPDYSSWIALYFSKDMKNDGEGGYYCVNEQHVAFYYRLGGKYYGVEYMERDDPVAGRNAVEQNRLINDFTSLSEFREIDVNLFHTAQ